MQMIDCEPTDADRMNGKDFVALAEAVLEKHGAPYLNGRGYKDDWIGIRTNYNGLDLEITRQAQAVDENHRRSHLRVSNPTTMVSKGEVIRHHGEYVYLTQHMRDLLA